MYALEGKLAGTHCVSFLPGRKVTYLLKIKIKIKIRIKIKIEVEVEVEMN